MLSVLVHIQSLRFVIPSILLVGVSPQYFVVWNVWRALSSLFPRRVYEYVDEIFYDAYQSYISFFFETYNGTQVTFYGDELPTDRRENVLYICNHQCSVDWVVTDLVAIRQGSLGNIRYVLKSGLRFLPLYGFYFAQHGCIFIKRNSNKTEMWLRRRLKQFVSAQTPFWLVIFPEGTRYNVEKPQVIEKSKDFSKKHGLPILNHVLVPRLKAVQVSLDEIKTYIDAVYDLTIVYHDPRKSILPREEAQSLTEFLSEGKKELHIHLNRIKREDLPQTEEETKAWLYELFEKKDKLLSAFYDSESGGKFSGHSYKISLPFTRTFVPCLFFVTIFSLTLASKQGRSLYWKWWLGSSMTSLLYMGLFYDTLQA